MSDNEEQQKRTFAEALLRFPNEPFKAACVVFPNDAGKALQIVATWSNDVDVLKYQNALVVEHGAGHFLPSKDEFVNRVIQFSEGVRDAEAKLKGFRLIAEMMGWIERPTIQNNTFNDNRRVMIVKDHGDDEAWERKMLSQQTKLITDAATDTKITVN